MRAFKWRECFHSICPANASIEHLNCVKQWKVFWLILLKRDFFPLFSREHQTEFLFICSRALNAFHHQAGDIYFDTNLISEITATLSSAFDLLFLRGNMTHFAEFIGINNTEQMANGKNSCFLFFALWLLLCTQFIFMFTADFSSYFFFSNFLLEPLRASKVDNFAGNFSMMLEKKNIVPYHPFAICFAYFLSFLPVVFFLSCA